VTFSAAVGGSAAFRAAAVFLLPAGECCLACDLRAPLRAEVSRAGFPAQTPQFLEGYRSVVCRHSQEFYMMLAKESNPPPVEKVDGCDSLAESKVLLPVQSCYQ
jgi:hypothetical protein